MPWAMPPATETDRAKTVWTPDNAGRSFDRMRRARGAGSHRGRHPLRPIAGHQPVLRGRRGGARADLGWATAPASSAGSRTSSVSPLRWGHGPLAHTRLRARR